MALAKPRVAAATEPRHASGKLQLPCGEPDFQENPPLGAALPALGFLPSGISTQQMPGFQSTGTDALSFPTRFSDPDTTGTREGGPSCSRMRVTAGWETGGWAAAPFAQCAPCNQLPAHGLLGSQTASLPPQPQPLPHLCSGRAGCTDTGEAQSQQEALAKAPRGSPSAPPGVGKEPPGVPVGSLALRPALLRPW